MAVGEMLSGVPRPAAPEKGEAELHVVLRYRSTEGVANAVAAGIGIAPVSGALFEDPAFREVLTPILPEYPLQQGMLYVVYASHKFVAPKLRTFVDLTAEFLASVREPKPGLLQVPGPLLGPALTSDIEPRVRRKSVGLAARPQDEDCGCHIDNLTERVTSAENPLSAKIATHVDVADRLPIGYEARQSVASSAHRCAQP